MQVGIESMPKPIQEFIGNAQKRFTTWEGQARETITDTYNKMLDYPTVKKVEKTFDDWYSKHNPDVYFKPLKKRVEKFSTSWGNKAFSTVGLAEGAVKESRVRVEAFSSRIATLFSARGLGWSGRPRSRASSAPCSSTSSSPSAPRTSRSASMTASAPPSTWPKLLRELCTSSTSPGATPALRTTSAMSARRTSGT